MVALGQKGCKYPNSTLEFIYMPVSTVLYNVDNDPQRASFMTAFFDKVLGPDDFEIVSDSIIFADHACSTEDLFAHLKDAASSPDGGAIAQLVVAEISGTDVFWRGTTGAASGWLDRHLNAL